MNNNDEIKVNNEEDPELTSYDSSAAEEPRSENVRRRKPAKFKNTISAFGEFFEYFELLKIFR